MCLSSRISKSFLLRGLALLMFLFTLVTEQVSAQMHSDAMDISVVYGTAEGVDLKLDIAYPIDGSGPFPGLIFIYGNGWGTVKNLDRIQYYNVISYAARRGYVAISVDYRYTYIKENGKVKFHWPAQLYDVKCAVRWLRANAAKYRINPDKIGAVGFSSGAHLSLMLGLTDPSDGLEGTCEDLSLSSAVQAVVSFGGPTDLARLYSVANNVPCLVDLIGGSPEEFPAEYASASPVNYVSAGDPPILAIVGSNDFDVQPYQIELLDAKMKELGLEHTFIIKEGAGHRDFSSDKAVWAFLEEKLK